MFHNSEELMAYFTYHVKWNHGLAWLYKHGDSCCCFSPLQLFCCWAALQINHSLAYHVIQIWACGLALYRLWALRFVLRSMACGESLGELHHDHRFRRHLKPNHGLAQHNRRMERSGWDLNTHVLSHGWLIVMCQPGQCILQFYLKTLEKVKQGPRRR